jgi:hypothetical protein
MEKLKQLEKAIQQKDRTQDDIIKYLLASKEEMKQESKRFVQTEEFQKIREKLRELNKKFDS